jgi:hypothetical protein
MTLNLFSPVVSLQVGYDFFMDDFVPEREYNMNPNPNFDMEAYLTAMEKAKDQYSR